MKKVRPHVCVSIVLAACLLGGCSITDESLLYESVVMEKQIEGKLECVEGNSVASEWVDTETGVHYFFTSAGGLVVRLNADGTPYVDKGE